MSRPRFLEPTRGWWVLFFSSSCFRRGRASISVRPVFLGVLGTVSSHDPQLCSEGRPPHLVASCVGKLGGLWVAGEAGPHPTTLLRPKPGMLAPPYSIPHTDGELVSPLKLSIRDAEPGQIRGVKSTWFGSLSSASTWLRCEWASVGTAQLPVSEEDTGASRGVIAKA